MQTRFLTVFNDMNTTGLLLENDRGVVVGRTREDPLTLKAMHISKDRRAWDEVKKCYARNAHKPQSDVDFLTEDGKRVFKTAEECLSYDLMQRFGVSTLDDLQRIIENSEPAHLQVASRIRILENGAAIIEGSEVIKPLPNDHGMIEIATDAGKPAALVGQKSALHGYGIFKTDATKDQPPIPDFKVESAPVLPPPVETSAKKAKASKPAAKFPTGETLKEFIKVMQELVSRGGLLPATLAKRLGISEATVLRIVADREDLFIARENGKIYKA